MDYNIHVATHKKGLLSHTHSSIQKSIQDNTSPSKVDNHLEKTASEPEKLPLLEDAVLHDNDQDLGVDILNTSKESKDSKEEMDSEIHVTTDSKGNFIYTCNICKVYKGNEEKPDYIWLQIIVTMCTYANTLIASELSRPYLV